MSEMLAYPFMQRALAAGLLVGAVTSVLGVFVVLRRSAFFGDAVAHASLAGVAVGVVTKLPPLPLAAGVAVAIGVSLHRLERGSRLSLDTILGFVLPFFMAVGVLVMSLSPGFQPELLSYLFGSILAVSWEGLAAVAAISLVVAVMLAAVGRRLVFVTFDPDGALVGGIRVARLLTVYHVLLALMVVASLSIVGIVLVNALLVIPAATAKLRARSLSQMFVLAPVIGMGSVLLGLVGSYWLDVPSGPAIVVVAGLFFLAAWAMRARGLRGRPAADAPVEAAARSDRG
jgi:ABC-type Mn2+/Zn2+ transport system permease subunit